MQNFEYCTPTRIIFGQGVIAKLPEVLGSIGRKVLLTYGGGSIKRIGEMAHHIAANEGLDQAYAPLTEEDIAAILTASL